MKNGVWTPFGVTFASSMQTALRQTSNCLFSMRSYRVSLEYDTRTHFILRLSLSLSPSLSLSSIRSLALARNRLFFSLSHHHASFSFFTDYTFRSLVHELHASIFLSLSGKQASSPFFFFYFRVAWSFVHPWTKKVCVNDRSLNIAAVARLRLRSDHIFLVRCWPNDLAYT